METNNTPQTEEKLSESQFRSLHKFFGDTAKEMNENGITMTRALQRFILEVPATKNNVKEMWKILQESLYGTNSTKELLKKEQIDKIYDSLNLFFAKEFGMNLPNFPSLEEQIFKSGDTFR